MPLNHFSLLVFTLLLSGAWCGSNNVLAGVLPQDTQRIESLTPEQASAIVEEFKGIGLNLDGLEALDSCTAKALAEFRGSWLSLAGLTTLDVAVARALSGCHCKALFLNGLTTLDIPTAKTLAEFKGDGLCLIGLAALDIATAEAIAESAEHIFVQVEDQVRDDFFARHSLTPKTARAWAALSGGHLSMITVLDSPDSVAIATALATRKGLLSLPRLRKISPKTLSALIAKDDVDIPRIETLELIREPDGSPNDDFVMPEGFRQRQNQHAK